MATPTVWINSKCPYLPIVNPRIRPQYIRVGDIVGYLKNPEDYLNQVDNEQRDKCAALAEAMKTIIAGTLQAQDLVLATEKLPNALDDHLEEDQNWGPKTSAVPEEPTSGDITELMSLGPDIPEEVMPKLCALLKRNHTAFGVDSQLGKVQARVEIPLQPQAQPISLPMYGASPAKREVIDKQMKTWFEAEVIEPSVSPWGFPCVVTYCNGKPCLVVNYRKLNTITIPDEFPIPCQSEIIQTLSGLQVLSSFNVLVSFTQLEIVTTVTSQSLRNPDLQISDIIVPSHLSWTFW